MGNLSQTYLTSISKLLVLSREFPNDLNHQAGKTQMMDFFSVRIGRSKISWRRRRIWNPGSLVAKVSGYVVQLSRPKLSNAAKVFFVYLGGVLGEKQTSILLVYMMFIWFIGKIMFFSKLVDGSLALIQKKTIDHEVDRKPLEAALSSKNHLRFDGFYAVDGKKSCTTRFHTCQVVQGFLPQQYFGWCSKRLWFLIPRTFGRSRIFQKCLKNWMISPAFGVRFWSCHGLLPGSL